MGADLIPRDRARIETELLAIAELEPERRHRAVREVLKSFDWDRYPDLACKCLSEIARHIVAGGNRSIAERMANSLHPYCSVHWDRRHCPGCPMSALRAGAASLPPRRKGSLRLL